MARQQHRGKAEPDRISCMCMCTQTIPRIVITRYIGRAEELLTNKSKIFYGVRSFVTIQHVNYTVEGVGSFYACESTQH